MTDEENCKQMIDDLLRSRLHDFELALDGFDPETGERVKDFDFLEWLDDYILSFSDDPYYRAKRMELSVGGPGADSFLMFNNGLIEYRCATWGGEQVRTLFDDDLKIMEQVRDYLIE